MRLAVTLALLFALGAPAAQAQGGSEPVALIAAIYKTYTDIGQGDPALPGLPRIYSKRLQALIDKDAAETPEGEVGRLDWDPFVDGQDWELTGLKIAEVYRSGDKARVRATFANFGEPRNILFDLVREDGQWRVNDIAETLRPRWTLSKILTDAPDAFPDAGAE